MALGCTVGLFRQQKAVIHISASSIGSLLHVQYLCFIWRVWVAYAVTTEALRLWSPAGSSSRSPISSICFDIDVVTWVSDCEENSVAGLHDSTTRCLFHVNVIYNNFVVLERIPTRETLQP